MPVIGSVLLLPGKVISGSSCTLRAAVAASAGTKTENPSGITVVVTEPEGSCSARVLMVYPLHPKARSATAGLCGVRVVEREAAPVQSVGKVDFAAHQVEKALLVDVELQVFKLQHLVVGPLLGIEGKRVAQPRTSPSLDADPQAVIVRDIVLLLNAPYLPEPSP